MKTVRVSAAVIHSDERVFIVKRSKGKFKGYWEFPGGKIEEGESAEHALVREIKEELSALIEIESFIANVEYDYGDFYLFMSIYLAKIAEGDLVLREHEDALWLESADLDNVSFLPADKKALPLIKKALE